MPTRVMVRDLQSWPMAGLSGSERKQRRLMISALVFTSGGPAAPPLASDLSAAGVTVHNTIDCPNALQEVIKRAPDFVVCFQDAPDPPFFALIASIAAAAPRPVVVFTTDPDAEKMATAASSGVHAYVVAGYSRTRLRSVMQLAQARFRHEQVLRGELDDLRRRFDERTLVDRAKGILMGARQVREDEAYRALRGAAMASKQRIGQVSKVVIDSAHYAEAVNRAGQLRMLSQRLVKFYALACSGDVSREAQGMFADSIARVDSNLAVLDRNLSKATFGDLLGAVVEPWTKLHAALKAPPKVARLHEVDRLAETLLEHAETLTANLEVAAFATVLRAINVAGRQRMLVQRLAKEVLIGVLLGSPQQEAGREGSTLTEFVSGLDYLDRLPLTNAEIARELGTAHAAWRSFRLGLTDRAKPIDSAAIAASSEVLLGHFDRLTDLIERGIHAMMGF